MDLILAFIFWSRLNRIATNTEKNVFVELPKNNPSVAPPLLILLVIIGAILVSPIVIIVGIVTSILTLLVKLMTWTVKFKKLITG